MKIKLAEALLRRKELQQKVTQLEKINTDKLFEVRVQRKNVTESIDDVVAAVPKIGMEQATHAYDTHAKRLRLIDAAIQQANWTTEIDIADEVMADYVDPYIKK